MEWHITPSADQATANLQEELRQKERRRSVASRQSSISYSPLSLSLARERTSLSSIGGAVPPSSPGPGGGHRYSIVSSRGSSSGASSSYVGSYPRGSLGAGGGSNRIAEEDHLSIIAGAGANEPLIVSEGWRNHVRTPTGGTPTRTSIDENSWGQRWGGGVAQSPPMHSPSRIYRPKMLSSFNPNHGFVVTRTRTGGLDGDGIKRLPFAWRNGWEMRDVSNAVREGLHDSENVRKGNGHKAMEVVLAKVVNQMFNRWNFPELYKGGNTSKDHRSDVPEFYTPPGTPISSVGRDKPLPMDAPEPVFISLKARHAFSRSTLYYVDPLMQVRGGQTNNNMNDMNSMNNMNNMSNLNNMNNMNMNDTNNMNNMNNDSRTKSMKKPLSSRCTAASNWKVPYNVHSPGTIHLYRNNQQRTHKQHNHHHLHLHNHYHHQHRHSHDGAQSTHGPHGTGDCDRIEVSTNEVNSRSQRLQYDRAEYTWNFRVRPQLAVSIDSEESSSHINTRLGMELNIYATTSPLPSRHNSQREMKGSVKDKENENSPNTNSPRSPSKLSLPLPLHMGRNRSRPNSALPSASTSSVNLGMPSPHTPFHLPPLSAANSIANPRHISISSAPQTAMTTTASLKSSKAKKKKIAKFKNEFLVLEKFVDGARYVVGEYHFLKSVTETDPNAEVDVDADVGVPVFPPLIPFEANRLTEVHPGEPVFYQRLQHQHDEHAITSPRRASFFPSSVKSMRFSSRTMPDSPKDNRNNKLRAQRLPSQSGILILDSRGINIELALSSLMIALKRERQRKVMGMGGLVGGYEKSRWGLSRRLNLGMMGDVLMSGGVNGGLSGEVDEEEEQEER